MAISHVFKKLWSKCGANAISAAAGHYLAFVILRLGQASSPSLAPSSTGGFFTNTF